MTLNKLATVQKIPNLLTLKAQGTATDLIAAGIPTPQEYEKTLADGDRKIVTVIAEGDITPILTNSSFTLLNVPYVYRLTSTADALEPGIVQATNPATAGRWFMENNPVTYQAIAPAVGPGAPSMVYYAELTSPARIAKWVAPEKLPASPVAGDWIGDTNHITDITGEPTFNADFVGQKVRDTATGYVYQAVNNTGLWKGSLPDNGGNFIPGAAIAANATVDGSYSGKVFDMTASAVLTLPAGLPDSTFKVGVFTGTLDLATSGTTINGGTGTVSIAASRFVEVSNTGDIWRAL